MKKALFCVLCVFFVAVSVQADSVMDEQIKIYRLKYFCAGKIDYLNYIKVLDYRFGGADLDISYSDLEDRFSRSLRYTYKFCSCVIDSYLNDLDLETVINTINTSRFWDEVVPRYSEGEGVNCSPEGTIINLIKYQ